MKDLARTLVASFFIATIAAAAAPTQAEGTGAGGVSGSSAAVLDAATPPALPEPWDAMLADTVAATPVGYLPGGSQVTPGGAYVHELPLDVPPGRAGMVPRLSLRYASGSGNGPLGVGWQLTGFSRITRCAKTWASDGLADGIDFDASDAFCLDGARLVPLPDGTWRTEQDSFAKVLATGSSASGPEAFQVWRKEGTVAEYTRRTAQRVALTASGPVSQAEVRVEWLLTRERDRSGNQIEYVYTADADAAQPEYEVLPLEIRYTQHALGETDQTQAQRVVKFVYELGRPDPGVLWQRGVKHARAQRLAAIEMHAPNPVETSLAWRYELAYVTSTGTGRSLLTSVRMCGALGGCLWAKQFEWALSRGVNFRQRSVAQLGVSSVNAGSGSYAALQVLDADGDGADDVLFQRAGTSPAIVSLHRATRLADGGVIALGSAEVVNDYAATYTGSSVNDRIVDLDADGRHEICHGRYAWHWDTAAQELVKAYPPGAPQGGAPWTCSHRYELISHDAPHWVYGVDLGGEQPAVFADLDGDRRVDRFVAVDVDEDEEITDFRWHVQLNTGSGWGPMRATGLPANCPARVTDLDGDGRAEFLTTTGNTRLENGACAAQNAYVQHNDDGASLDVHTTAQDFVPYVPRLGDSDVLADLNGDGLQDVVRLSPTDAQQATVFWNSGHGHGLFQTIAVPHDLTVDGLPLRNGGLRAADFNADGRDDLLVFLGGAGHIAVLLSQGNGTFTRVTLPYDPGVAEAARRSGPNQLPMTDKAPGWTMAQLGDFNGDGRTDLVRVATVDGEDYLMLLEQAEAYSDLLTAVFDEATVWPREQITYDTRYADRPEPAADGCGYPVLCTRRAFTVVREVASRAHLVDPADPATAPAYRLRYSYEGPATDLGGRGFLGFATVRVWDPQRPQETVTTYDHRVRDRLDSPAQYQYPTAHRPTTVTTIVPLLTAAQVASRPAIATARITRQVISYALQRTHGDRTHVVHPHAWYRKEWEEAIALDWNDTPAVAGNTTGGHLHDWAEPGAGAVLRLRDGTWAFDDYGNLRLSTAVTEHGGTQTTTQTHYRNDPATWLIGLPEHRTTTHRQGTATVTRTVDYTHDVLGRLIRTDHNRDHPDPGVRSTVAVDYDAYGLPIAISHRAPQGSGTVERHTRLEYTPSYPGAPDERIHPSQVWSPDAPEGLQPSHWQRIHPAHGGVLATMDANGVQTATAYDDLGRPVTLRADGSLPLTLTHAGRPDTAGGHNGLITTVQAGPQQQIVATDAAGRPLATTHTGFDGTPVHQRRTWDLLGRPLTASRPYQAGDPARLDRTAATWTWDSLDRLVQLAVPDPTGTRTLATRYDHRFDRTTVTDPKGHRQRTEYDIEGRLARQIDLAPDGTEYPTAYTWGPLGVDRVTDPGQHITERTYDLLGRVVREVDPDTGTTEQTFNGLGDLLQTRHPGTGETTTYAYDPQGRPIQTTGPDGTTTWTWDLAPHGIGRLAASQSPDQIATTHGYDPVGRPVTTEYRLPGANGQTTVYRIDRSWRPDGLPDQLLYPVDRDPDQRVTVQHVYNAHGHLTALDDLTDPDQPRRLWHAHERRPDGSLQHGTLANGAIALQQRTSPHTGQLEQLLARTATSPTWDLLDLTYAYDDNGLVHTRNDVLAAREETFAYDHLDRLAQWRLGSQETARTTDYGYDPLGNLTTVDRDGHRQETLTYGNFLHGQPHAAATRTTPAGATDQHLYDPRGRLIQTTDGASGDERRIDYNAFDLPTKLTRHHQTWTFAYDARGQRIRKHGPDGTTITLAGLYEHRRPSDGPEQHVFHVPTPDHASVQITRTPTTTDTDYVVTDALGSAGLVLDENGQVTQRLYYEPFGTRTGPDGDPLTSPTGTLRQGFTGHDHEPLLGLINMKGRMYDPALRRFLTPDPVIGPGSQGRNPYSYVRNSPLNYTDPSGWEPCVSDGQGGCKEPIQLEPIYIWGTMPPGNGSGASTGSSSGAGSSISDPVCVDCGSAIEGIAAETANAAWYGGGGFGNDFAGEGSRFRADGSPPSKPSQLSHPTAPHNESHQTKHAVHVSDGAIPHAASRRSGTMSVRSLGLQIVRSMEELRTAVFNGRFGMSTDGQIAEQAFHRVRADLTQVPKVPGSHRQLLNEVLPQLRAALQENKTAVANLARLISEAQEMRNLVSPTSPDPYRLQMRFEEQIEAAENYLAVSRVDQYLLEEKIRWAERF